MIVAERLPKSVDVRMSTRPLRIAFLVPADECERNHWILDGVFRFGYSKWGGARYLIVPYRDNEQPLDPLYNSWLRVYEPDIIYSYVDIDEVGIKYLDGVCLPITFCKHRMFDGEERRQSFTPGDMAGIAPVGSLSTIASQGANYPGWRRQPTPQIYVTQELPVEENRFFPDNFGVAFDTMVVPSGQPGIFETLCYCEKDTPENHIVGDARIHDDIELLSKIANKEARTFGRLAALHTEGAGHTWDHDYDSALNLFIGTSVIDRVNFWNSRHFTGFSNTPDFGALIVSPEKLEDEGFVTALGAFLNNHNFRGQGGGNGIVKTYSQGLSADQLAPLRDKIGEKTWNTVLVTDQPNRLVTPSERAINQGVSQSGVASPAARLQEREQTLAAPEPNHFQFLSAPLMHTKRGQWAVDLEIERHQADAVYSNAPNDWRLPRRSEAVRAFSSCQGKVSRGHTLVLMPNNPDRHNNMRVRGVDRGELNLKIPDDDAVFRHLITTPREAIFQWGDVRADLQAPANYDALQLSDKGRHHFGLVSMMDGDLKTADCLTNVFWRQLLRRQFSSEGDRLAESQKGFKLRKFEGEITGILRELMSEFVKRNQYLNIREAHKFIKASAIDTLEHLVQQGVVQQQYLHTCRACGNHQILSLDTIERIIECSVCKEPFNVPIDLEWRFAFSPFVLQTLVQRNGLTALWALRELFETVSAGGKTAYLPEANLLEYEGRRSRSQEIDILAICEGQYVAAEVKHSAEGFIDKANEIEKFTTIMERLAPDVACLAFEIYNNDQEKVDEYKVKLAKLTTEIQARLGPACKVKTLVAAETEWYQTIPRTLGYWGRRSRKCFDDEVKRREKRDAKADGIADEGVVNKSEKPKPQQ